MQIQILKLRIHADPNLNMDANAFEKLDIRISIIYVDLQCFYNFIYVFCHQYCGLLQLPATEIGPNTYMGLHNFNWLAQLVKEKYKTAAANNKNKNENLLKEKTEIGKNGERKKIQIFF